MRETERDRGCGRESTGENDAEKEIGTHTQTHTHTHTHTQISCFMYAPPLTPEASQTRTDLMSSKFRAGQRHIRWCGVQVAPESLTGVIRPGCVMLGLEMRFHSLVDMTTACKALLSHCHWNTTLLDSTASDIDMSIDGSMYGVRAAPPPPPPPRPREVQQKTPSA